MKKDKPPSKSMSEECDRFERAVRQILAGPKSELDKRQAQYEKERKAAKKKKAA